MGILVFIVIIGLVVFVHEFGHFIMARRAGIFVEEFAMGMGPKILEFKGKKQSTTGEVTVYTLRAFPVGGFCKMRGMEEVVPDDAEAFNNKGLLDRLLVIAGGSVMNFVLALVIFFVLLFLNGYRTLEVWHVNEGTPAAQGGLQAGDRVTHIDGNRVVLWEDYRFLLDISGGREMEFRVDRNGEAVNLNITPIFTEEIGYFLGFIQGVRVGRLTYIPEGFTNYTRAGVGDSLVIAARTIGFHIQAPFRVLARFLARDPLPEEMGGVQSMVGIGAEVTRMYSEAMAEGVLVTVLTMVNIAGFISVALGTMNLLPIPALDGARLVFLAIEGIRKKPVSQEKEGTVHMIGFILLMVLIVVLVVRDIINLI